MDKRITRLEASPAQPVPQQPKVKGLIGVGLDNDDGHKRLTQGEQFVIAGGSEETHERMTETFVKTIESLKQRGKALQESAPDEVAELLHKHIS